MEIGAGSGQEACGRATQNASKIEKVEEKIDGCSPAKTRLEPKKPSKTWDWKGALEGGWSGTQQALGRPWQALAGPGRLWQAWQALALAGSAGRLWQAGRVWQSGRLWQALAGSGRLWQVLAGSGRLWAGSGRLWQALAGSEKPASGGPVLFLGVTRFFVGFKGIIIFMRLYAS